MSKSKKNNSGLKTRSNSAKTILQRAKQTVPGFESACQKFEQKLTIGGYASSTIFSYSRAVGSLALHFNKSPLVLDDDEINEFLFSVAQTKKANSTYFKHLVYGLRFFFRLHNREDRVIKLPSIKGDSKLPVVLSRAELKLLFFASQRLKHRVALCLVYSAGLRLGELCRLKIADIDSDRMQIRVIKSKGKTDRYVPLSSYLLNGLRKYFLSSRPQIYLFNGRTKGKPISKTAIQRCFRLAVKKANILKQVSVHSLRHTYATHLLEEGVDIVTIKDLLGHATIQTTMMYLHVAKLDRINAHSPLDTIYLKRETTS